MGDGCVGKRGFSSEEDDVQAVVYAAATLQTSEFEVFRLAYREWFGRPAETRDMEACFHRYLATTRAPAWVRSFVRRIRKLADEGCLDLNMFGLESPSPASKAQIALGVSLLAGLLTIVAFLIYSAFRLGSPLSVVCQLPPCY
jgi:hypothetical protein